LEEAIQELSQLGSRVCIQTMQLLLGPLQELLMQSKTLLNLISTFIIQPIKVETHAPKLSKTLLNQLMKFSKMEMMNKSQSFSMILETQTQILFREILCS
jgi:hypothetical protein